MFRLMAALVGISLLACGNAGDPPIAIADVVTDVDPGPTSECPPIFGDQCLSVWPWFGLQKPAATKSGASNDLMAKWLPQNNVGKAMDVSAFNRRDGVSPVTPIVILPPHTVDPKVLADETKPEGSLASGSATVMVDAATGKRIRHVAELDQNTGDDKRRALLLRSYAPLGYGRVIIVGLTKNLLGKDGQPMPIAPAFAELVLNAKAPANGRLNRGLAQWKQDLSALAKVGVAKDQLVAAWHFTTASADWVTGPAIDLRNQVLAQVGASGLGLKIQKIEVDPAFVAALPGLNSQTLPSGATLIVAPIHQDMALRIQGEFETPLAMTKGQDADSTLNWQGDQPKVLADKTGWRPFVLIAGPKALQAAVAPPLTLYGHGFLRTICLDFCVVPKSPDAASHFFHAAGAVAVGTEWWGLSQPDLTVATAITSDLGRAPELTDKLMHGAVFHIALSRAIQAKLSDDPRFGVLAPGNKSPRPLTDGKIGLRYTGNSLGGIMGTTLVALHPDIARAVVNVASGGWSTMMNRSSNFSLFLALVTAYYPDPYDQQLLFALMQTHWDLNDPVHFAGLAGLSPLPGSHPDRKVLWPISWGDSQVPNLCSATLLRGAGAPLLGPPIAQWPDVKTDLTQPFDGPVAMVQWDSLRGEHPPGNGPRETDNGSHYATRWMPEYQQMMGRFLYGDGKVEQRYCLARDTDKALPCTLLQEIPQTAAAMPPLADLPPTEWK